MYIYIYIYTYIYIYIYIYIQRARTAARRLECARGAFYAALCAEKYLMLNWRPRPASSSTRPPAAAR